MAITYNPATNFSAKDSLPTNDPDKVIKGSEFSVEFTAIQTAFGLAAPAASPTFTGTVTISSVDINGGAIDGTTIGGATPAAGTFSSLTATTADINGGTLDGVTIGGSSAGAITGTTGQFNTSLNVDGTVTADGLTVENNTGSKITLSSTDLAINSGETIGEIDFYSSDQSGIGAATRAKIITLAADAAGAGDVFIKTSTGASAALDRLKIANNGDISFYEDTGTTPKFFWNASAEALGIGTTSPATPLDVTTAGGGNFVATFQNTTSATPYGVSIKEPASAANGYPSLQVTDSTGSNVRFRVDSGTGKVGIGDSSPDGILDVEGSITIAGSQAGVIFNPTVTPANNNVGSVGLVSGTLNAPASVNASSKISGLRVAPTTSGSFNGAGEIAGIKVETFNGQSATLATGLYVDAPTGGDVNYAAILNGGNVGIGTSSPSSYGGNLVVSGTGSLINARSSSGTSAIGLWEGASSRFFLVSLNGSDGLAFVDGDGSSERMRLDSSGNLLVGTTTAVGTVTIGGSFTPNQPALYMKTYPTSHPTAYIYRDNTDAQYCLKLRHDGPVSGSGNGYMVLFTDRNDATVGSITVSGSTTAYNTSSDARLKENIADAEDAGAKVDAIKVRQFDWKADGSHQDYGMVAQELLTVAPEAVSGDPESDDMMGVDFSKLVPMMLKEIQSLRARVAQLEGA